MHVTPHADKLSCKAGFTLIELSIALVIIGFIVGGVLVGQDLIAAARVRAQITQIDKYNQAVNFFYGKYHALPGDMSAVTAAQFGFAARGSVAGQGDGNGIIQGCFDGASAASDQVGSGEQAMFWVDLSTANGQNINLIEGGFNSAAPTIVAPLTTGTSIAHYMPQAKIGYGNYVYVYGGGPAWFSIGSNGINYFGVSAVLDIGGFIAGTIDSAANMPVKAAYNIDSKIDDGLPQSGTVTANYFNESNSHDLTWAGTTNSGAAYTTATQGGSTTCFDNDNADGPMQYSIKINSGSNPNCALSFKMQAGD